jgi:hypothetical protein
MGLFLSSACPAELKMLVAEKLSTQVASQPRHLHVREEQGKRVLSGIATNLAVLA